MSSFEAYIKGKNTEYNVDYRCKRKNGRYIWINDRYIWINDRGKIIEYKPDGSVGRMIGAHSNINNEKLAELDLVEKNELLSQGTMSLDHSIIKKIEKLTLQNHQLENKVTEIEYLSNIDPLTKASNRKKFELEINKEISRANRYNHPLSFAIFDIDHFKVINDQLGHKAGDILLCEISELVAANIRDIDMLARWGGDEFVIIFPEQSIDLAHKTCEKLRLVIEEQKKSITYAITCSFGVTQFEMNENFDRLFQRVDKLLLKAKNNGRNVTVSI